LLAFLSFFLEWLLREEKLDVAKYRCAAFVSSKPWFHEGARNVSDTQKTHVLHGQGCKPAFCLLASVKRGMALRGKDGTLFLQPKKGPSNLTGSKKKLLPLPFAVGFAATFFFGLEC
jgi:hypothetical protein